MDVPAVVVPYDPRWPEVFDALRDRADAALAGIAHLTEHVGSTAVPGLDAKPIVDLDVVVPDAAGRPAHRDHVDLRDFLRAHPDQAARYGELKRALAGLLETDRAAYADGKAQMIAELLRQARTQPAAAAKAQAPGTRTERIRSFFPAQHEPPPNELPEVLAPALTWRGDEIIMAIPSLLVYSTGGRIPQSRVHLPGVGSARAQPAS